MPKNTDIVAQGMRRISADFATIVERFGFKQARGRKWIRVNECSTQTIWLSRKGASYGAARTPTVSLMIDLISARTHDGRQTSLDRHAIARLRRDTGHTYHYRFNTQTLSGYARCVEDLELFLIEVAIPWFDEQRDAA